MPLFSLNKKMHVLIVEDDVRLRASLREQCENNGFSVSEASDASAVLALLAKRSPDVMVLDLILPLQDGVSLLEDVRHAGYEFPVLILSNLLGSDELRKDAERLGAAFFNKSSVSLDDIIKEIKKKL